jgi:hypothetical protein
MKRPQVLLLLACLPLALSLGCAARTPHTYHWGSYETALYGHYKNPQDPEPYLRSLREVIDRCESRGGRMPPGIYAEYGYALYEQRRYGEAEAYFGKEHDLWPESRPLMAKMIRSAEQHRESSAQEKER